MYPKSSFFNATVRVEYNRCIVSSYINCLSSLLTTVFTNWIFLLISNLQIIIPTKIDLVAY